MKAAILENQNHPLNVTELDLPKLFYGQVLVKVLCSTICGKQLGEISGAFGIDKYLPHLLGHEGCGDVLEIGPGVTTVNPGNRVVMHWRKGDGVDAVPPKYWHGERIIGAGPVATFADCIVVSENRVTVIPSDITPQVGSLMGCAVTTALGLINNEAQIKIGQSIAVVGCGGVGLNVIQGASLVSANPIIAIDTVKDKLGMASMFGATHVIDANKYNAAVEVLKIAKKGVDVFVECTGSPYVINMAVVATAPGGKTILVGQPEDGKAVILSNMSRNYKGKTIMDSQGGLTNPNVDIPRYIELYRHGKLVLDPLVTHTFPLDRVNEAIDLVRSGHAGRVALEME